MIGKKLAHYEILSELGKGGMGEVYRAHDSKLDRDVAIKILPTTLANDPERVARFEREARTLASLQHPNIASIYGFERVDDVRFLVMQLAEGEDLSQRLQRGALGMEEVVALGIEFCQGIEAAHDLGIIHRDLKPANLKIGPDGTLRVLDFGLARAYTGSTGDETDLEHSPTITAAMTQAGVVLGTAAYMSPEQARGKPLDRRTDIFSFGAVLFEMLTGKRVFTGDTVSDTLASVLKESPDFDQLPAETPPAVRHLLNRCLEKNPRRRLQDMGEARLILEAVRDGDPTASSVFGAIRAAESSDEMPSRGGLRRREILAWAGAAILLGLFMFQWFQNSSAPQNAESGSRLFSIPTVDNAELVYSVGGVAVSPDGTRVAYVDGERLFLRRMDSWDPTEVPESDGAVNLFWSPDSQWLGYHRDGQMWKVRSDGSGRQMIVDLPYQSSGDVVGGAWLTDDRIVFRSGEDLHYVSAAGGETSVFLTANAASCVDFHDPCAMDHGNALVVLLHRGRRPNVVARVMPDGKLDELITLENSLSTPRYALQGYLTWVEEANLWAVPMPDPYGGVEGTPIAVVRAVSSPSFSNAGDLVFVHGAGVVLRQLVLVDREGTIQQKLGRPLDLWAAYALAPDGKSAIVSTDSEDAYTMDTRGSAIRETFTEIEHDVPSFSPDGSSIYFSTGNADSYAIARKPLGGNAPEETIVPPGEYAPHYYAACPKVTSDGKRLFYTSRGEGRDQNVSWVDLEEGATPQVFLDGAARECAAAPSPADANYVAYVSDESGMTQVYLTTWPDARTKIAVSLEGGMWPHWRRDGGEIYFARRNEIYAVDVQYDPLRLGLPHLLFRRPENDTRQPFGWPAQFDVDAEGQRFLTTILDDNTNEKSWIAVIENWAGTIAGSSSTTGSSR